MPLIGSSTVVRRVSPLAARPASGDSAISGTSVTTTSGSVCRRSLSASAVRPRKRAP